MSEQIIRVGAFDYQKDEEGEWIYKANDTQLLKNNGALKKKEHDKPSFGLIYDIEGAWKRDFGRILKAVLKHTAKAIAK